MSRVIVKKSSYDYADLKQKVFELMDAFGGSRIQPGSRVLIKPNFLIPAKPETAVVTHPLLTRAVAEYVIAKGTRPQISDSPALGSFDRALKESGTLAALQGLDVDLKAFRSSMAVEAGEPFGRIELAAEALRADFVINLPKLKTHNLMILTLGVKNLFGCVIGLRKPEWHFRAGTNTDMLARLFVRIHEAIRPGITILDGILAMEGDGPGKGGRPKPLGVLMGSDDAYALDRAACRLVGIDPESLPVFKAARTLGVGQEPLQIEGSLSDFAVGKFSVPAGGISFGEGVLHAVARRLFVPKPNVEESFCKMCGDCRKVCPANAVIEKDKAIQIDYDKCIRCYCCTEICPHGALHLKKPLLRRLFKF